MREFKRLVRRSLSILPVSIQMVVANMISTLEGGVQFYRCWYLKRAGMQEFKVGRLDALPEECHILASGWSLNESFPLIDRSSVFVMGFNFSFLKCADPDLHFVENASSSNARFFISTMQHYAGLERFKVFESTRLVFKNLSEFKNSINLISWIYGERAEYVRDRHFRFFSRPGLRPTLRSMLREDKCMPQAVSSAVSLIFLARIMGFKKIVMHGLDFYGPHFYGVDLAKAVFGEGLDTSFSSEMEFHKTAVGESGVGTPEVLRELKSLLAEEGIQLMSALKSSPSSEVLGSYYD